MLLEKRYTDFSSPWERESWFSNSPKTMQDSTVNRQMEECAKLFTWFNVSSLLSSLASLVLSIVAIWMAVHFKRESDRVNLDTRNLLIDIKTDAKVVAQIAIPELQAYGEMAFGVILGNTIQSNTLKVDQGPPTLSQDPQGGVSESTNLGRKNHENS